MARNAPKRTLADSGTLLATTHRLEGGLVVRLRLTRPSDTGCVRDFLERLSPDARRRASISPMPRVARHVVDRFTYYDPRARLVIAATTPGFGGEQVVGLGEVSFAGAGDQAEVRLAVEDDGATRGIGRLLTEAIASLALARGAAGLDAA